MKQPLIERIKFWLCDVFGHLGLDTKNQWAHAGKIHCTCKFCGRIHSETIMGEDK